MESCSWAKGRLDQEQGRREQNQVGAGANRQGREAGAEPIEQGEQQGTGGSGRDKGGGARFVPDKKNGEAKTNKAHKARDRPDRLRMHAPV
jgi:hypothetical protein